MSLYNEKAWFIHAFLLYFYFVATSKELKNILVVIIFNEEVIEWVRKIIMVDQVIKEIALERNAKEFLKTLKILVEGVLEGVIEGE
ncbi:MAG: hypothetical protein ACRC2K_10860 [Clostridium sp.]